MQLPLFAPSHHRKPWFRRKHHHHPLVQRKLRQFGLSTSEWQYRRACNKSNLLGFEPDEPTIPLGFSFDRRHADEIVSQVDSLHRYHQYSILHGSQFLSTGRNQQVIDQALVAAADLRATYKATDLSLSPKVSISPYVLHSVDDPVVDTGAFLSLTPNPSDFVGPIKTLDLSSLEGLG
jgi:hypothetical protein